ncbi:MAG: alkaline phosphatase PhoX [Verrucomicrobiales bacterium]
MKRSALRRALLASALLAPPSAALAGTDTWFTPLTQSAPVVAPNSLPELSSPWVTPAGLSQKNIVSLREVEDAVLSPQQSIIRVPGLASNSSMFDMLAFDPTGNFLFIPHETIIGAGCSRISLYDNSSQVIFAGDQKGVFQTLDGWANDFGAFDPSRWTPNNTLFLAEEWSGLGRVVEILNPLAPSDQIQSRVLESIANVAHEGINFSLKFNDTLYFIDEWNSGSIYKFVMKTPGDFTVGQTFVLSVDAFLSSGGVANKDWSQQAAGVVREGAATWVPLTDRVGRPRRGITNPFRDGVSNDPRTNTNTLGGRPAADDVGATPYGRPEDASVGRLANGNEVIYIAVTSESKVISIEILEYGLGGGIGALDEGNRAAPSGKAIVRTFVSNGSPKNAGFAATTGVLNSPDNVALDALGNVYVIEDAPNGDPVGGDIWFARDTNNDGVAESLDHFLSIRVKGSEATGMIFNPTVPTEFAVAVQHPDSTNLANVPAGLGDAVWLFNVSNIPNQAFVTALNGAKGATNQ